MLTAKTQSRATHLQTRHTGRHKLLASFSSFKELAASLKCFLEWWEGGGGWSSHIFVLYIPSRWCKDFVAFTLPRSRANLESFLSPLYMISLSISLSLREVRDN